MTALKANEIAGFIKRPPTAFQATLVYGPDAGLVSERGIALSKSLANRDNPTADVIVIDDADLAANPDRLATELQMVSMFGGKQVIRLKAGPRLNPKMLEAILKEGPLENYLVIEAGDLKKTAKLRTLFEKSKSAHAIPCYADDARSISDVIKEELSQDGQTIAPEPMQHLQSLLGADRSLSRSELQKLRLYTQGQDSISLEDIDAIIGDSASLALDTICYAVTGANDKEALKQFDRALAAGHAPQSIALALTRHLQTMFHVRTAMDTGDSIDNAIRQLRPPIFYKRQQEFSSHCRRWSSALITRALSLSQETLIRCRTAAELEQAYTERLLLSVARLGA